MDVQAIREQFPILNQEVNGHPLVYLDSSATLQKPMQIIQSVDNYQLETNSLGHHGVHTLGSRVTELYEDARQQVKNFINAKRSIEIIFSRGPTTAPNMASQCYG